MVMEAVALKVMKQDADREKEREKSEWKKKEMERLKQLTR